MFQIENFTQDSISFLENIKDDDMQSKERVSKNMSFFHFQWGVPLAIIAFQYFYKKHWKSCQNMFYTSILGSTGCFLLFLPIFSTTMKKLPANENLFYIDNFLKK